MSPPGVAPPVAPDIEPMDVPPPFSVELPKKVITMPMSYPPAFIEAVNYVLDHERGFVNDPRDPGGATNMGITYKTLARWRDVSPTSITSDDVKNMSRDEAIEIYHAMYWDAVRADKLPPALAYAAFDFAVNSGPVRAVKELQKLIGTTADGLIGGHTLRRLAAVTDKADLVNKYADARLAFMRRIKHPTTKAPLWARFGRGWSRRVEDVRRRSLRHVPVGRDGGGSW